VDVALAISRRLEEFGLEQRDLAQAAQVTDSYISQLLTGKRTPPAPSRTSKRGTREAGGPPAEGAVEERTGGRAHAVVSGSS
jgi:hypothetical protein